jgi:hypothetical protein
VECNNTNSAIIIIESLMMMMMMIKRDQLPLSSSHTGTAHRNSLGFSIFSFFFPFLRRRDETNRMSSI